MAEVFANVGSILARASDIDLGPVLDEVAHEIEGYAVGLAAEHVKTTDYVQSIGVAVDRTSPSRRDRLVYSDDPAALSIESGHDLVDDEGVVVGHVPGQHILGRAAEAARGPQ